MASFGGFERLIESLVERSLIAPLRGRVQPIEIAKRLERVMQERALVNVGTSIAPNEFVVRLNPEDFQPLAAARSMLERELARHLTRVGAERGYAFLAPPIVRFVADPATARRAIETTAELREPGAGAASPSRLPTVRPPTGAPPASPPPDGESPLDVTVARGRPVVSPGAPDGGASPWGLDFGKWQVALPSGAVRVGRAPDCDVVVPSPRVSRYHAELSVDDQGARVRDLGSTNGTAVDGRPIREAELRPGDRVAFGGVEARLIERTAIEGSDAADA
jgi:hypothetical protein